MWLWLTDWLTTPANIFPFTKKHHGIQSWTTFCDIRREIGGENGVTGLWMNWGYFATRFSTQTVKHQVYYNFSPIHFLYIVDIYTKKNFVKTCKSITCQVVGEVNLHITSSHTQQKLQLIELLCTQHKRFVMFILFWTTFLRSAFTFTTAAPSQIFLLPLCILYKVLYHFCPLRHGIYSMTYTLPTIR